MFKVYLPKSLHQFGKIDFQGWTAHKYFYAVLLPAARTMRDSQCTQDDFVSLVLTATMDIPDSKVRTTVRRDLWYLLRLTFFIADKAPLWDVALRSALHQRIVAEVPEFADHGCDPRSNDIRNPFDGTVTRSYCFEGYKLLATLCDVLHPVGGSQAMFSVHLSGRWINRYVRCHSLDNPRAMWKIAEEVALCAIAEHGRFPLSGK